MVGVGEAVPDQHRADSLNTGLVKVPVKFSALAVVGSETRGGNAGGRLRLFASFYRCRMEDKKRESRYVEPPDSDHRNISDAICVTRIC